METQKMDTKSKYALGTAIVAFAIGFGLTIAGFFTPPKGEVHDSVLWILGQALIYTASVLGIGMYFNTKTTELNQRIVEMKDEARRLVREEMKEEKEEGDGRQD